ncbi:MAG: hypothetical protein ABII12_07370 [Planctomycetota bacterium]
MLSSHVGACACVCLTCLTWSAASAFAQPTADDGGVRRLSGIVDEDQTWAGRVVITGDLTIEGATVAVEAGTVIEFAEARQSGHPLLFVGSADGSSGQLDLHGSADRPIIVRTRDQTNRGRVVVNVRSRIVTERSAESGKFQVQPPVIRPNDIAWRHVRFENLGYVRAPRRASQTAKVAEPAVRFNVIGDAHKLSISHCVFEACTRLEVRAADQAEITVANNRFLREAERVTVDIRGDGGRKPARLLNVAGNISSCAFTIGGASAQVSENILIGLEACLVTAEGEAAETVVAGNYIHNTTTEDDGRYCVDCRNAETRFTDNIVRGGTACVLNGSRRMAGNVFIGAGHLRSRHVKIARTHQLVQTLPAGAAFEDNLLIGPAYSLLMPQPSVGRRETGGAEGPTLIRHNVFDGFSDSNRAIHLNTLGREWGAVAVWNNVFLRVGTLIYSEGKTGDTLRYADFNAAAPTPRKAFDNVQVPGIKQGTEGWAGHNLVLNEVAALRLQGIPDAPLPDYDGDLLAGKLTITQLRRSLFDAYRPTADCPLRGAGRAERSADGTASRPAIGIRDRVGETDPSPKR